MCDTWKRAFFDHFRAVVYRVCERHISSAKLDPQNVTIVLRSLPPRVSYSGAKSSVHNRKIAKLETTCESQEFVSRATAEIFTGLVEVL